MPKLLLLCPKCGHTMLYESRTSLLNNKTKKCVYCGKSFKAGTHIAKTITQ